MLSNLSQNVDRPLHCTVEVLGSPQVTLCNGELFCEDFNVEEQLTEHRKLIGASKMLTRHREHDTVAYYTVNSDQQ